MMVRWPWLLGLAIVVIPGGLAAETPEAIRQQLAAGLISHKAVYDLELAPGRNPDKSPVQAGRARLVYEFRGSVCEGWSTMTRLVTELTPQEGSPQLSDIRSNTFENAGACEFRFLTSSSVDGVVREQSDGTASQDKENRLTIKLKKPEKRDVTPGADIFYPTQHLLKLMTSARMAEKVVEADLFDGSETGEKIYSTTAIIGQARTTPLPDGDPGALAELKGKPRWPIIVSFFDRAAKSDGEQMPIYDLSAEIYENGITQSMNLNYPNFTMKGKLTSLELLPQAKCK